VQRHATFKHAAFVAIALHRASSNLTDEENPQLRGPPVALVPSAWKGSLPKASATRSKDCFSVPPCSKFKVRGKTYKRDGIKVSARLGLYFSMRLGGVRAVYSLASMDYKKGGFGYFL
jgi:hypothetical protein